MTAAKETRGDPELYATRSWSAKLADRVCQHNRVRSRCTIGANRFLRNCFGHNDRLCKLAPASKAGRCGLNETLADMELVTALGAFGTGVKLHVDPCRQLLQPARQG